MPKRSKNVLRLIEIARKKCRPTINPISLTKPDDVPLLTVTAEVPSANTNSTPIQFVSQFYVHQCENCHRRDVDPFGTVLETISIANRATDGLSFKKKLSSLPNDPVRTNVVLCEECYNTLMNVKDKKYTSYRWIDCWPAFLWKMFIDPMNSGRASDMWQYVPSTMRSYWWKSYQAIGPNFQTVTMAEPRSYFDDVTLFAKEMEQLVATGSLVDLMNSCNANHYCSVRCPWGCTEFPDECGYVSYAKLLYAKGITMPLAEGSFDHYYVANNKGRRTKCFVGVREDYLCPQNLFMNSPNHPVRPCIRFVPGKGPLICTCKEHDGGSAKQYLHPPVNPVTGTSVPCTVADQLAHAVVVPRMIKSMKKNKYSDTYQMQRCYGGFKGVDSCNIMDTGRFDKNSCLSDRNTTLFLYGRPDMRSKLSQMVEQKIVPAFYESTFLEMMDLMDYPSQSLLLDESRQGATFVPLADSMKMMLHAEKCSKLPFAPSWPLTLLGCQPSNSNYGRKPSRVPPFRLKHDLRLPWLLLSMACNIPALWECIANSVSYNGAASWHGWLLSFATKNVLEGMATQLTKMASKNPYKGDLKVLQLAWKLEAPAEQIDTSPPEGYSPEFTFAQLRHCLEQVQNVACFDSLDAFRMASLEDGGIASSTEVIVLTSCTREADQLLRSGFIVSVDCIVCDAMPNSCCCDFKGCLICIAWCPHNSCISKMSQV